MIRFVISVALALAISIVALTGCGEKRLSGERRDLAGFASAGRSRAVASKQQEILLPARRVTADWQQEQFSPLHISPHLMVTPELRRRFTVRIGGGRTRSQPLQAIPVVGQGRLFALSGKGVVFAFDATTGKSQWRQKLRVKQRAGQKKERGFKERGFGGGLALADEMLIVTTGAGKIYALAVSDGSILWERRLPFPLRSAPAVSGEHIIAITPNHRSFGFSLAGDVVWQHQSPNETAAQLTVAPSAGIVGRYAIVGYGDGSLFALDVASGQTLWKSNLTARRRNDALADILDITAAPVISAGVVYASGYSGKTVALDLASGAIGWSVSLATTSWLSLFGNSLFVVDSNGILSALSAASGKVIWEHPLAAYHDKKKSKPVLWNGPLLAEGRLIVSGSNGEIIIVDALDGSIVSRQKFKVGFSSAPLAAGGLLFLLDSKGKIHAFE